MNQRIKELAEQAGYTPLPGFDFANDLQEVFLKKFAELIVKECCVILTENVEVALDATGIPVYPEGLIQEHFGVTDLEQIKRVHGK